MSPITAALSTLEQSRSAIGEDAYALIRAGLDAAGDLRTTPGRDATASTLVRSREEFRRQPHIEAVRAPAGGRRPAAAPAPAAPARKRVEPPAAPARPVRGMTLGH